MFIQIDRASSTPIQRQIMEQIRAHCASGKLKEGDRLPSSRLLAAQTGVHPNTILIVYERLASEGLVEMRCPHGTFVAKLPDESPMEAYRLELTHEIQRLIRRSMSLGLSPEEFLDLFDNALASALPEPTEPAQAEA